MKEISVRQAIERDKPYIANWLAANALLNHVDPDILSYPQTKIYAAVNGQPVCFMPVQMVAMLESLAPNPEADNRTRAEAIRQLVKGIMLEAYGAGIREIYFVGTDKRINRVASRHGFQKINAPVYRMKL